MGVELTDYEYAIIQKVKVKKIKIKMKKLHVFILITLCKSTLPHEPAENDPNPSLGKFVTYQIPPVFQCIDDNCEDSIGFIKALNDWSPYYFDTYHEFEDWAKTASSKMYNFLLDYKKGDTLEIIADCGQITYRSIDDLDDSKKRKTSTYSDPAWFGLNHRTGLRGCFPAMGVGNVKYKHDYEPDSGNKYHRHDVDFNSAVNEEGDFYVKMMDNQERIVKMIFDRFGGNVGEEEEEKEEGK